jgi:hypothetical protein
MIRKPQPRVISRKTSTDDVIMEVGRSVEKKGEHYLLRYSEGRMGGKTGCIEITAEEFWQIKKQELSFDELCIRHNVG